MVTITTATDIEKLTLARDVLQEQIDARVAARAMAGRREVGEGVAR